MNTNERLSLSDIISRQVLGVAPDCPLGEAAATMARSRVSCLVVLRDGYPVGLLTEHDLIKLLHDQTPADIPATEIMSAPVISAPVDLDFWSAFALMQRHHIRHLVALANDGNVAGIATASDFRTHISLDLFRSLENLQSVLEHVAVTLPPETPLAVVLERMALEGLEYVLASRGDMPVGILTERDIPRLLGHGIDIGQTPLGVVMSHPLRSLALHVSVAEAAEWMARYRVRQLPIINDRGALIGVVSQTRLLEKLGIGVIDDLRLEQERLNRVRRLAEEAAAEQRANVGALFEVLSDFLFVLDEHGRILHYNPSVEKCLGYGPEIVGQSLLNLCPPEDRIQAREVINDILAGSCGSSRFSLLKTDRGQVMVDARVTRTLWSGQTALLCVARDMSAEYAAQAALRASEARFRTLFETANDGLIILREGQVIDCNAKALAIYGREREMLIGTTPDQWSPPRQPDGQDSPSKAQALMAAAFAGQSLRYEWRHCRPDGSEFDAEVSLNPVQVGDETLLQAIVHDITLHKRQRAELEEALRLLDESQAIAKVGGWQANPLTDHLRWTREIYRLLEHPIDQPPAGLEEGLRYYAPESLPVVRMALVQSMETGEPFQLECRMLTRTGREFWAELRCSGRVDDSLEGPYLAGTFQDISARKRMESALRISEENFRRAQSVAHTGSWFLDCISNSLEWSEETYRIFGMDPGRPIDLEAFLDRVHADDRDRVVKAWDEALAGAPYDIEHRVAGFSGRWVRERAEFRCAADGTPLTALGTVQDISERHRADSALKASHQLLQTILEALPIRVFWKDRDCRYLGCNTLFARDAGEAGPADIIGKDDFQLGWHDQADLYRADDLAVMATGIPKRPYEEPQTTPDGQTIWLRTAKVPLFDSQNNIFGILGIYEDITLEWRMRQDLQASQERLRLALEGANDGLWDLNLETGDVYYSPRWLGMLGYRPGELPATRETKQRLLHPDDLAGAEAALAACRAGQTDRYEIELRMRHREGHWVSILSRATLACDEQGQLLHPLRLVGTHVDISERKRVEQDLETARAAADSANRAKSQFLANMSHEIRTPMNAIIGLAQLLEQEPLPEESLAMVQSICAAGRSLMGILNDILDFSKIEAGQLALDTQTFDLAEVLEQLDHLLGESATKKGLAFHREASPLPGRLVGDALRLEQILINLVGNAVKFTERGEIILRVRPLAVTERNVRLRFEVSDTGIGMTPEASARLFQPFTQADTTITRQFGGTGLGLSISKRLIELMGGQIGVESQAGAGSTFWFELPFERGAEATPERVAESHTLAGSRLTGLRVLVVDDNQINRFLIERVLQKEGAQATLVKEGRQALDQLRESPLAFDVVLMDIQMPVMDGLTATRGIREQLGLADLPVIALTAGVLPEERQSALEVGMNGFLGKPIDLKLLVSVLSHYRRNPDPVTETSCRAAVGSSTG